MEVRLRRFFEKGEMPMAEISDTTRSGDPDLAEESHLRNPIKSRIVIIFTCILTAVLMFLPELGHMMSGH